MNKFSLGLMMAGAMVLAPLVQAQTIAFNNSSFEAPSIDGFVTVTPDSWGYFASGPNSGAARADGVTDTIAQSGSQSLWLSTNTTQGAGYESHYILGTNTFADSSPLALTTTSQVELSFWIRSDASNPYSGSALGRFRLEFHDNTQGGNPNVGGTGTLEALRFANDGFSTTEWVQVTLSGTANAAANNLVLVLENVNFPSGDYVTSSGIFYVDNVSAFVVVPESTPALLGFLFFGGCVLIRRQRSASR